MRLIIKNKFFSLSGSSYVTYENGENAYIVKGKLFSITKKKFLCDLNGNKIYMIRNKWWKLLMNSALIYDDNNNLVVKVKQKFGFRKTFNFIGYKDDIKVDGNFLGWDLTIYKNNQIIGTITRQIDWTDSFILDTNEENDIPLIIAIVIAIDNIFDNNQDDLN